MNKSFLSACILSSLILCQCNSENQGKTDKQTRLKNLQDSINTINIEIGILEKEALNDEVEGQGAMTGNYHKFVNELLSSEEKEKKAEELQSIRKKLELEKQQIERSP